MKKCQMSVSGKHRFQEYFDGFSEIEHTKDGVIIGHPKYILKCSWCGLIDDRKEKK